MKKSIVFVLSALFSLAAFGKDVGGYPNATALGGTERALAAQTGVTVNVTPAQFWTYSLGQLTSANVISKWSGSCDLTHFLRGDGTCATVGTVTSVGLTLPAWLSVSGSPVTTSGTLAVTATGAQTANQFLATPDGTTGAVGLRSIVSGDLPSIDLTSKVTNILPAANGGSANGFFAVSGPATSTKTFTFPNASATVLTSNAAVTVPQGGTGVATLTSHGVLLGEGTSNVSAVAAMAADTLLQGQGASADPAAVAVNNCGDSTHALSYNTGTHAFGCQAVTGSGGSPAGSSTQVQFNSSGSFGADAGLAYVGSTTQKLTLGTSANIGTLKGPDSSTAAPGLQIYGGDGTGASNNGGDVTIRGGLSANNAGAISGNLALNAGPANGGTGGYVVFNTGPPTERFRILANGAWSVGSTGSATGSSSQVLTSNGSSSAPTWQTPVTGNTVRQAVASSDLSRSSTIVQTADAALVISAVAAGTYEISGNIQYNFAGSGTTPGALMGMQTSVAVNATSRIFGQCGGTNGSAGVGKVDVSGTSAQPFTFNIDLTTPVACTIKGTLIIASSTDVSFTWSQANSSGTATVRQAGSWIRLEKLQ